QRSLGAFGCHQYTFPVAATKCSTIGPSDRAGKKVSAPTIRITPTNSPVNRRPWVGNVPGPGGTVFLPIIEPAIPRIGMIMRKRPTIMVMASVMFHHGVLALSPPNAEPLLPAPLVYAYSISLSPCGPALFSDDVP